MVNCRPKDPTPGDEITPTGNVSQGGILLATANAVEPGARLAIKAVLPLRGWPRLVLGTSEAVESSAIILSFCYETRVRLVNLDRRCFQIRVGQCAPGRG